MIRRWFGGPPPKDAPVVLLVLYRLRWALLAMAILAVLATVGYVVLEGYGWIDAVYMTVITLGTVGYSEIHPLDTTGRVLTIGVIIVGFATFVYAVSVLTNLFVSGDVVAPMHHGRSKKMREELDHHVIVVGFGRVGQAACVAFGRWEDSASSSTVTRNRKRRSAPRVVLR